MGPRTFRQAVRAWAVGLLLILAVVSLAGAHEGREHADPELLNHWRTQVHLLFQWAHLVAFALWVGGMLAASRLPRLSLERLLFGSWALLLVSLGTGTYNMEYGAATPDPPDILALPVLSRRYEFGAAYISLIGVKQALFLLAALLTLTVTALHLRWPPATDRGGLRRAFVVGSVVLGLSLAAVTAAVLVLHEAVDLAPTPLHSLGGVVGPRGPEELAPAAVARQVAPPPYGTDTRAPAAGFRLLALPRVAGDATARFGHLIGFALWLGGTAAMLATATDDARRVLPFLWLGMALQGVSGAYQMLTWTPFALVPYPSRLSLMEQFRFGYTYTLLLTAKLGLAGLALLGTVGLTLASRGATGSHSTGWGRRFGWLNLALGLVLAYVAVALLLVHEGIDHAL